MSSCFQRSWGLLRPFHGTQLNGHEILRGLVSCYLFNEPTAPTAGTYKGALDLSPHRLHCYNASNYNIMSGPIAPGIAYRRGIEINSAVTFDGDINSELTGAAPGSTVLQMQNQTMSAWVYLPSAGDSGIFWDTYHAGTEGGGFGWADNEALGGVYFSFSGMIPPSAGGGSLTGYLAGCTDHWIHLVLSYEPSSKTLTAYRDGIAIGTGTPIVGTGTSIFYNAAPSAYPSLGKNSTHKIASLMLWNRLLTANEIYTLYSDPWCFVNAPGQQTMFFVLGRTSLPSEFVTSMDQLRNSRPVTKIEFIDTTDTITDISSYWDGGGSIEKIKERAPAEIQAGGFDITVFNHDDKFSEYKASSMLYGLQYHGARIRISQGFVISDGSIAYEVQAIGFIDSIDASSDNSRVTFRCRDLVKDPIDHSIHVFPLTEVPAFDAGNTGNGTCSQIETKPFKTVTEDWTLTCTTPGGDGVGVFSVIGSVSGDVGDATSGTEFSTGTGAGGIKFTVNGGTANWIAGDIITFSTKGYPQWTALNPIKIIWSILTGYDWDTNTQNTFSALVLDLSNERDGDNPDLNYESFAEAVTDIDVVGIKVKGYAAYNESAYTLIKDLLLVVLGSLYTDARGRISIRTYVPHFKDNYRNFADTKKITSLGYNRSIDEVINSISVEFKRLDVWQFSDEEVDFDQAYYAWDNTSIGKYGKFSSEYQLRWYVTTDSYITDFADKLLDQYAEPPLNIDFDTGLDALRTDIGDRISVTDAKYGFSAIQGEVTKITKQIDAEPHKISLRLRRDGVASTTWAFLGSSANEADGISPQTADWDSATGSDKLFAYLSQTGGGGPDYRIF